MPLFADASALQVSPDELKAAVLLFYSLLDEQQRRLFAGLESIKLGLGGDTILAAFLHLDAHTVARGRQQLLDHDVAPDRVRRVGGGRTRVKKTADIVTLIEFLLEYDTAGDPITGVKWSPRTTAKVAMALGDFGISANTVARLLQQDRQCRKLRRFKLEPQSDRAPKHMHVSSALVLHRCQAFTERAAATTKYVDSVPAPA